MMNMELIARPVLTRRAFLVWQAPLMDGPGSRRRHKVAELVATDGRGDRASFRYLVGQPQFEQARLAGFTGYPGLPLDADQGRLDRVALDLLMCRLPPRNRGDFGKLLKNFGLQPADHPYPDMSLLAYTGAGLTRDSFSVCESFDGFEPPFAYVFDAAGYRHYHQGLASPLQPGEAIGFMDDPNNAHDPNAIRLARTNGETVGYVNRLQTHAVGRWVGQGAIAGTVFRVNSRVEYPRLFVRAEIRAATGSIAA